MQSEGMYLDAIRKTEVGGLTSSKNGWVTNNGGGGGGFVNKQVGLTPLQTMENLWQKIVSSKPTLTLILPNFGRRKFWFLVVILGLVWV